MANSVASSFLTVLSAIRQQILNSGLYSPDQCFLSLHPDLVAFPSNDRLCSIAPGGGQPMQDVVTGAGNIMMLIDCEVYITLWSRCALDEKNTDTSYLTDNVLGMLSQLDNLLQTLQLATLSDSTGNMVTAEPMRLQAWTQPKKLDTAPGWGALVSLWTVKYQQTFDGLQF